MIEFEKTPELSLDEAIKLLFDSIPKVNKDKFQMMCGKTIVRQYLKGVFGENYTFNQMMSLFRSGHIYGNYGTYIIKANPYS